jgi:predicted outer membrane protein
MEDSSMKFPARLLAVAAVGAAAACSSMPRTYSSTGDVDLAAATPATLGSDETMMLRQMSDANIIGHLLVVDSLEIALADTALRVTKSDIIGEYARMMHLNHDDDRKALRDIAGAAGLIPTIDVQKLQSSHVAAGMDSVRRTSEITKDQRFLQAQIELHRHALAELQVLRDVARNPALREHIVAMIPVVQNHLARAQTLAGIKGA